MQACTCSGRSRGGEGRGGGRPRIFIPNGGPKDDKKVWGPGGGGGGGGAYPPPPPPPFSTDAYKNIMNIAWACQACVFLELQFILN